MSVHGDLVQRRLPRKSRQQSGGDPGRQGVHPNPWKAPSAAPAMQIAPAKRQRPSNARAYTQPLGEHHIPRLPRKSPGRAAEAHGQRRAARVAPATQVTPAERRRPSDARAYIRPLGEQAPSTEFATQSRWLVVVVGGWLVVGGWSSPVHPWSIQFTTEAGQERGSQKISSLAWPMWPNCLAATSRF